MACKAPPAKRKRVYHDSHASTPGVVLIIGQNDCGQLGLKLNVEWRKMPGIVPLPRKVVQVACGGMHTVCLTVDGEVYTFGCNDDGALGRVMEADKDDGGLEDESGSLDGTLESVSGSFEGVDEESNCGDRELESETTNLKSGLVQLDSRIVQVSAGDSHSAALTADGRLYAWGTFRDDQGIMGLSYPCLKPEFTPVSIDVKDCTLISISSGCNHIVCLTNEGTVLTFGCAAQGQLGRVSRSMANMKRLHIREFLMPLPVWAPLRAKFKRAYAGQYGTFAQQCYSNDTMAWGLNNWTQLGISDQSQDLVFVPEPIPALSPADMAWSEISSGLHHTVLLTNTGQVYSMGCAHYGRLGHGGNDMDHNNEPVINTPTLVSALQYERCVHVACGVSVSYAVTNTGVLYAWGMGCTYLLGKTDEGDESKPVVVGGEQLRNRKVLAVSAGGQHTAILATALPTDTSHTMYC